MTLYDALYQMTLGYGNIFGCEMYIGLVVCTIDDGIDLEYIGKPGNSVKVTNNEELCAFLRECGIRPVDFAEDLRSTLEYD